MKKYILETLLTITIWTVFFLVYNLVYKDNTWASIEWFDYAVYAFIITISSLIGKLSRYKKENKYK